jgi:hypothetical protein
VDFSDSENFFKKIFFDFELDFLKSSFFVQTLSSHEVSLLLAKNIIDPQIFKKLSDH